MGKLISTLALEDKEIDVVAACDVDAIGQPLGNIVGVNDPKNLVVQDVNDLQKIIEEIKPDVAVDFTVAKAAEKNCMICVKNKVRCIIGTTGLSDQFLKVFEEIVIKNQVPAVISSNMATGVNILFKIASY